jgi:ATP-dependent Lon protease
MRKPQNRMENRQVGAVCRKLARRVQPGPMSLILTGQLGEVMKESARAALTYATNNAPALGIPPHRLDGAMEAHIHVPAGAIPKDRAIGRDRDRDGTGVGDGRPSGAS